MDYQRYKNMVDNNEISISDACKALRISRQTWYNRKKTKGAPRKKGRPRKHEPEKTKTAAPIIDLVVVEKEEKKAREMWLKHLEKATETMKAFLNKTFPNTWCNLRFEHVDAAGYWYSFELVNDSRRQTWSIRHYEINRGGNNELYRN